MCELDMYSIFLHADSRTVIDYHYLLTRQIQWQVIIDGIELCKLVIEAEKMKKYREFPQ